jgi:voltage-gated potassium channel
LLVEATLRTLATVAVLVTLYFVLPFDRHADIGTVAVMIVGCGVLVVVVALQIRTISRSEHPNVRAAEALAFTIPFYLVSFAVAYFLMAQALATNFTEPLTRIDALYFSVTVFTTVGFGDIAAKSEAARVGVTAQMLLDLLLLGLVVRLYFNAVKRSQQRHGAQRPD